MGHPAVAGWHFARDAHAELSAVADRATTRATLATASSCAPEGSGLSIRALTLGNTVWGDSSVPVLVTGLNDAVEVSAGAHFTWARHTGGAVVCWGVGS